MYKVFYQRFFSLLLPDQIRPELLPFTHRLVREIEADSLNEVYHIQQGENWSPNGEARPLIASLNLRHTSMSMGDLVLDDEGNYQVCDFFGWKEVESGEAGPGPDTWLWMAVSDDDTFLKITDDRDCLPPDAQTVERFKWVSYEDLLSIVPSLEQNRRLAVCIEIGDDYYETEEVS